MQDWLLELAESTNTVVFAVTGSFIEEVIAPIPSPFILVTTAGLAEAAGYVWWQWGLLLLAVAAAKTVAAVIVYFAFSRGSDWLFAHVPQLLPFTEKQIAAAEKYLHNSWWDDVLLLIARSLPIVPSLLVSAVAGIVNFRLPSYIILTFLGTVLRSLFYFWVGVTGVEHASALQALFNEHPITTSIGVVAAIVVAIGVGKLKDKFFDKLLEKED